MVWIDPPSPVTFSLPFLRCRNYDALNFHSGESNVRISILLKDNYPKLEVSQIQIFKNSKKIESINTV
jgi:hypothetical protein